MQQTIQNDIREIIFIFWTWEPKEIVLSSKKQESWGFPTKFVFETNAFKICMQANLVLKSSPDDDVEKLKNALIRL